MIKKLFVRDLEKRKSASQLFVNPMRGNSHDTSMHQGGRSYNKPGYGQSNYGKHKQPSSEPKVYPLTAKYAIPEPTPTVSSATEEGGYVIMTAKYAPPGGFASESGSSAK